MVDKSIRGLERERTQMERQEKKLIMDMKACAKKGQDSSVKIMAKDLVRIRKHQEKLLNMCAQLRGISLQMTEVASTATLAQSMGQVTRSMTILSQQIKLPALQKIMMEFAKQSDQMEMKQEMLTDAVDDAMNNEADEEEEDAIVGQVLDEIGIGIGQKLADAPKMQATEAEQDRELESRLNNLKN